MSLIAARSCSLRRTSWSLLVVRTLALTAVPRRFPTPAQSTPWFVEDDYVPSVARHDPPHLRQKDIGLKNVPEDAPRILKDLRAVLAPSPLIETSTLIVTQPEQPPPGPPLPFKLPQGKRRRGRTYSGESAYDMPGGIWDWVLMAQVKEGTENRGAIESLVRVVRKHLLQYDPPLPLPPKSKRRMHNGWALIDGGDIAIHILSKSAREKYFSW